MNRHSPARISRTPVHFTRTLLVLAFASVASQAHAQQSAQATATIEEIVVTADFRAESVNAIPASISVLDSTLIQKKNALHLEDILLDAPNVNVSSGASRARFYQIRGIGERGQFTEPLNSSVGLLIDGVDFSGIGNAAMLYDMEQVEILMGPQGTRYGSNALAGLINLQSRAPTQDLQAGLQMQGANYAGYGVAGYLSGPVSDTLAYRVSLQTLASDGYGTNRFLDKPTNTRDESTLRAKLRWQPLDTVSVNLTTALVNVDNGYDAFSLDNTRVTLSDEPGEDSQDSRLVSLDVLLESFDKFSVQALAGFADSDTVYGYDEDWAYAGIHPDEYQATDRFDRTHDTKSGELRFLSTDAGALLNGRTSWVAGLYALDQQVGLVRSYSFLPGPFTSEYEVSRRAVFADTSTQLTSRWSIDAGLRGERFDASYRDSASLGFDPSDSLFGGKLALNYRSASDSLYYASVSRGYKTGGFNTDGSVDADLREFDKEVLWNYELGFKGELFDGRLQTRAALFLMDRDDVQISSSMLRLRADGSTEFIDYIGNAAAGRNRGLELAVSAKASTTVQLYGTLGLLDTEYRDYTNSEGQDLDGRAQAHAPRWQYTLGSTWNALPGLALDINVQGRGSFYFSDSHFAQSAPYSLLNASLTYTHEQWQVTLWGRNLTDKNYHVRGYYFGNDPRDGYTAKDYLQLGEPLRYGLTVNLDI